MLLIQIAKNQQRRESKARSGIDLYSKSEASIQVCIFISLNRYGSLTTSMMDSFRKIFNIVLSILINGYDLTSRQSLGLTLGISGIVVNLSHNYPLFLQEIHCKQCLRRTKIV